MRELNDSYAGILLAAGRGSRFDSTGAHNKLLQRLETGEVVAARAATAMRAVLHRVVAVTRPDAGMLNTSLSELGCEVIVCPAADQGMGVSLAFAISHARDAAGWIISLADMPRVQVATFQAVRKALERGADIAVPVYRGRRGNPAGFSRRHLTDLLAMSGDQGARRLLQSFSATEVLVDDPGIHMDIDTADDLVALSRPD
jgi:molybdenum cofactor cytidylyltransferase